MFRPFKPSFESLEKREVFSNTFGVWLTVGVQAPADAPSITLPEVGQQTNRVVIIGSNRFFLLPNGDLFKSAAADTSQYAGHSNVALGDGSVREISHTYDSDPGSAFGVDFNPVPERELDTAASDVAAHDEVFRQLGERPIERSSAAIWLPGNYGLDPHSYDAAFAAIGSRGVLDNNAATDDLSLSIVSPAASRTSFLGNLDIRGG